MLGLFIASSILTLFALFMLGFIKSRFANRKWWYSGIETILVGAIAAGASYLIGYGLE